MSERSFDIIVIGATGYTGTYIVKELVLQSQDLNLKLAIAGRNLSKLQSLKDEVVTKFPSSKDLSLLTVDVTKYDQVLEVTKQAKVVISAVGPFKLFGLKIVEACATTSTCYVDIAGEPDFVEKSYLQFNQIATQNDATIVHYCGFDSIPADVGTYLVRQKFKQLGATMTQLELFIHFDTLHINYTTFQTLILAFSSLGQSNRAIRDALPQAKPIGRKLPLSLLPGYDSRLKLYTALFLGADPSVLRLTQNLASKAKDLDFFPIQISAYFGFITIYNVLLSWFLAFFIAILCRFETSKHWLLHYPQIFTLGRVQPIAVKPKLGDLHASGFQVHFLAKGVKDEKLESLKKDPRLELDVKVQAKFSGPDPGYIFTSKSVVASALTILEHKYTQGKKLPSGIVTPAIAFKDTNLMERLKQSSEDVVFEYL